VEAHMSRPVSFIALAVTVGALVAPTPAAAQVLGTFRWQFAPYCNTVTLTIQQVGGQYTLTGFDDMCGGAARGAPASGTAIVNADGTVGMAITVTRGDGIAVQHAAVFTPAALSGVWSDDYGNGGAFVFSAPSPSPGSPRPVTLRGDYGLRGLSTSATVNSAQAMTAIAFGRTLPSAPQLRFVLRGTAPPAECPGTSLAPQARPGFLCVFETYGNNRDTPILFSAGFSSSVGDRFGAMIVASNTTSGIFGSFGTWAVTIP